MIKRELYMRQIRPFIGQNIVKVLTGIRRCGKSYLLFNIFGNYLLENGVKENNIIKFDLCILHK